MTPGTSIIAKLFCVNAMRMEKGVHPRPLWAEKQLRILFRCPEQNIRKAPDRVLSYGRLKTASSLCYNIRGKDG